MIRHVLRLFAVILFVARLSLGVFFEDPDSLDVVQKVELLSEEATITKAREDATITKEETAGAAVASGAEPAEDDDEVLRPRAAGAAVATTTVGPESAPDVPETHLNEEKKVEKQQEEDAPGMIAKQDADLPSKAEDPEKDQMVSKGNGQPQEPAVAAAEGDVESKANTVDNTAGQDMEPKIARTEPVGNMEDDPELAKEEAAAVAAQAKFESQEGAGVQPPPAGSTQQQLLKETESTPPPPLKDPSSTTQPPKEAPKTAWDATGCFGGRCPDADKSKSEKRETKAESANSEKSDSKNPSALTDSSLDSRAAQRSVAAHHSAATVHQNGKATKTNCFGGQCPMETGEKSQERGEALAAVATEARKPHCWGGLCNA